MEVCDVTKSPQEAIVEDLEQGLQETQTPLPVVKHTENETDSARKLGRQSSQDSLQSIMAGVRERLGAIGGGLFGSSEYDPENDISASRGSRSVTNRRTLAGVGHCINLAPPSMGTVPAQSECSKSTIAVQMALPAECSKSTTLAPMGMPRRRCSCSPFDGRGIPFRVAVICPTLLMLLACIGVFVPMAMFSLQTQQGTFRSYRHSVLVQRDLISTTVLNATQWVLLEASQSVEQAVFTGIVEPPDRAVDTLSGAIHLWRSRDGWDFSSTGQRRTLSYRAWEELNNQWTCTKLNNNLCSGRALSLYAAFANGQVMGSSRRPRFFGSSLLPAAQFSLDSEGGQTPGKPSELKVYEVSSETGRPQELYSSRPFSPTSQPFFTVQELLARQELQKSPGSVRQSGSGTIARQLHTQNKKTWSELFVMRPWWAKEGDGSHGVLGLSWTAPLSLCGNYSCMDGVVAADTTLDLVGFELHLTLLRLQQDLARHPWNYDLDVANASIFIVNQVSPNFPGQEGLLIGASSLKGAMPSGTLVHAVNSTSSLVASTSHAVLQHFGSWSAAELTQKDQDQTFHFSLSAIQQGEFRECDPIMAGMEVALDCFQATTHTIFLDDKLQWLVVAAIPVKAFNSFYAHTALAVEDKVRREQIEAEEQSRKALIKSASVGLLAGVVVLLLGLGASCLVVRPLARLSILMRRLGQLDFAHESAEYGKLRRGQLGRVREVNELQDGFCRLSKSIETFARFVPDTVVRRLVSGDPRASRLNVTKRKVTIMFSDIRDFTRISEDLKQDDLVFVLTLYLSVMTRIIESFGGVVGEILGDGILAFWNTPDDVPDHADKALAAALAQQHALGAVNAELKRTRLPELAIRIGLHTGEVLTGNIGSESKMKFGCIGDPVNLASRLEGLCKIYGVGIICSQAVVDLLSPDQGFACRKLDLVQVKGKKEPTVIYEAMGREPRVCSSAWTPVVSPTIMCGADSDVTVCTQSPVPAERLAHARLYEQALECYSQRHFSKAARLAAQLLAERPDDVAAERLQRRCLAAAQPRDGQDATWSPVVTMDCK